VDEYLLIKMASIVAVAVAAVFAFRLMEAGHPEAGDMVPITFLVIIGTVAIYGSTVAPLAHWLQIAKPNP
jgi:NhaP-type Na+/H+ or K+/H+ antiporter